MERSSRTQHEAGNEQIISHLEQGEVYEYKGPRSYNMEALETFENIMKAAVSMHLAIWVQYFGVKLTQL